VFPTSASASEDLARRRGEAARRIQHAVDVTKTLQVACRAVLESRRGGWLLGADATSDECSWRHGAALLVEADGAALLSVPSARVTRAQCLPFVADLLFSVSEGTGKWLLADNMRVSSEWVLVVAQCYEQAVAVADIVTRPTLGALAPILSFSESQAQSLAHRTHSTMTRLVRLRGRVFEGDMRG
jgi:hypothetical protein